ncbi:MAG: hypothetical protein ACI89J_002290, partial [Hyphomicrobiaceae bacterium]
GYQCTFEQDLQLPIISLPLLAASQNFSVSGFGCGDAIILVSDMSVTPVP